jgi:chromate transporter
MIYLELFITFFKIGLFTFGGGYAMIPLIQEEVLAQGWLSESLFYNFIGISESTPGPIAINMATFIGSNQAGLLGGLCATIGVVLPSFIIILLIASILKNFDKNKIVNAVLKGMRPVIVGLILATGMIIAVNNIIVNFDNFSNITIDYKSIIIMSLIILLILLTKKLFNKKLSPILIIVLSAIFGMIIYAI